MSQYVTQIEKLPYKIDKMIYSPIRNIFSINSNVKKRMKRNSFEKRNKKNISSEIIKNNNENIIKPRKKNQSLIDINDNSTYNYINNNIKSSIFNTYANGFIKEKNSANNYIQLQNNIININNNQYSYKQNVINTINSDSIKKRKIITPSYKLYNINEINNTKKKKEKHKKDQIDTKKNIYTSRGVFKYKKNKNKELNNNKNINNVHKKIKESKNIPELEMPYSSRYLFSSKKINRNQVPKRNFKINNTIKNKTTIDNIKERKKNKIKDIVINYRNTHTKNNLNNTNINLGELKHNSTISNFSNMNLLRKENSTKLNYEINTIYTSFLENNIYSPKKFLSRIHSQENIYNNKNKIKILLNNKNKSFLNLNGFTYKKKNSSYIKLPKENTIDEIINNIKPDIYPEIKINLRNARKTLNKNNSAIYEKKNNNSMSISDPCFLLPKNNFSFVYIKNKIKRNESALNPKPNKAKNIAINSTLSNNYENTFFDIDTNEYILKDKTKEELITSFISNTELNYIIVLLEKIKDIFDSLFYDYSSHFIMKYCFEFIIYMYNYNIDNYISNAIIDITSMENRKIFNNYYLLVIVIIYDLISKEKKLFDNLKILIKENIKLIYANTIIIINFSKDIIISQKNLFLEKVINKINSKYNQNKDLFIDDNEYLLINKGINASLSPEDKLNYNLNFIIRNLHTIINNMKKSENYNYFLQIFKHISNISFENIYDFYMNNIYQMNIINSTLTTAAKIFLDRNNTNFLRRKNKPGNKLYTLLISLDETLIHFKIDNKTKDTKKGVIQLRPWLNEFLSEIKPYYEIIVFSNGDKKYTELIINALDKKKLFFDDKLFRDNCVIVNNDFVKDIRIIGKDITKVIIVDNLIQNYRLQIENGINIKSFYGEINDKILVELGNILVKIAQMGGDVRNGIKYYKDDIINKVSSNIYLNYYK